MTLQAVFFDMGGTIDTFWYTREQRINNVPVVRECLSRAGIILRVTDEQLNDMITQGASDYLKWNMVTNIELKPAEIWSRYYLKGSQISSESLAPIAEELAFLYETRLFIRRMRPEIPDVLAAIKEMKLKIGCISNTQSLNQVPFNLKEYGILDYFDPIVLSSSYGRRKPDPAIFHYAARLANVPASACVYVGDKINRDILGAQRAGFRLAVQIKHEYDNGDLDVGASPDAVIQKMTELLPILENTQDQDRHTFINNSGRKIKAIFFDAGDILYHRPHRDQNLNKFLTGKEISLPANFASERQRLKDLAFSGKIKRHEYYDQVLRFCGVESAEDLTEGIAAMSLDDNTVEIMPDVPETLMRLKEKGFILGIITDTAISVSRKLTWFDQHGFGRVWDTVISSKEMGVRKPSPAMYEKALHQTGVCANQAVFIGHKRAELDGAREAGMHTIAFNYEKDAVADIYIRNFLDLLDLPLLNG